MATRNWLIAGLIAAMLVPQPADARGRGRGHGRPRAAPAPVGQVPVWDLSGGLTLISDYRTGGISSTRGRPAIQADALLSHRSGLFASAWASSISPKGGGWAEVDLSAGYRWPRGRVRPSLSATLYLYPGLPHDSYGELNAGLGVAVGKGMVTLGAGYAPRQAHLATDNLYLGASLDMPIATTGVILDVDIGRENGAFGERKLDWLVGGRYRVGRLELGAAYVDSARAFSSHAGPTVVLSARAAF